MSRRRPRLPPGRPLGLTSLAALALAVGLLLRPGLASAALLGPRLHALGGAGLGPERSIADGFAPAVRLRVDGAAEAAIVPLLSRHLILTREWMQSAPPARGLAQPIDLRTYADPRLERPPVWQEFMRGRYGIPSWGRGAPGYAMSGPGPVGPATEFEWHVARSLELVLDGPRPGRDGEPRWLEVDPDLKSAVGCRARTVTIVRTNGEYESLPLVDCNGAVTADAVDRISVLARPYGAARPRLPLPDHPDTSASARGEWVAGVKLLHPRLLWVVDAIARRFGGRTIYLVSGYRPESVGSNHARGRALDLRIHGVSNESLFAYCRALPDVGCGYYPNSTFVHVDVRSAHAGHVHPQRSTWTAGRG